jgi:hypothetical protein
MEFTDNTTSRLKPKFSNTGDWKKVSRVINGNETLMEKSNKLVKDALKIILPVVSVGLLGALYLLATQH